MNEEDDDDEGGADVMISFEQEITMVRLMEDHFLPSQISIKAQIYPLKGSNDQDLEIAFQKVSFWLDNVVSRCIAFKRSNEAAQKMLISEGKNNSSNMLMLTPEEPTDEMMAILFQAKMTALSEHKIAFGSVEIKSNNWTGLRFTFLGDASESLPNMDEWVGSPNYFDEPWWNRDDASTLDVVIDSSTDTTTKPAWAYKLDFIANAIRPAHETIARPIFKPKIIDGGKKDD